jgi:hypothetical protein
LSGYTCPASTSSARIPAFIKSCLVRMPIVHRPCGSMDCASLRESELARCTFAGEIARMTVLCEHGCECRYLGCAGGSCIQLFESDTRAPCPRDNRARVDVGHTAKFGVGHPCSNFLPRPDCIRLFSQPGALIPVTVLSSTGSRSGSGSGSGSGSTFRRDGELVESPMGAASVYTLLICL